MICRATLKSGINADRYVDRGITVCDEWLNSFLKFHDWAVNNGYDPKLQLDRRDNSKGYSPENCRFVTPIVNANNKDVTIKILFKGELVPIMDVLRQYNMVKNYAAVNGRIQRGWNHEKAILTPIRKGDYGKNKKKTSEGKNAVSA